MIRTKAVVAVLAFAGALFSQRAAAFAADLSLGIDPMVLQLAVPYGGAAQEHISITNSSAADELVFAKPIDWRTTSSGDVLFEQPGTERSHSLTASLKLVPSSFLLHAGETRSVAVVLSMPPGQTQTATLWGGFILRAASSAASNSAAMPGGTILVYNTVGTPRRHLGLAKLGVNFQSHALVAKLVNDGDTYVRPIVHVLVERGQTVVMERVIPCNVIFAGDARQVSTSLRGLPPAAYRIHFLLDYGNDSIVDGVTDVRLR